MVVYRYDITTLHIIVMYAEQANGDCRNIDKQRFKI